jgi:hypothetical protein
LLVAFVVGGPIDRAADVTLVPLALTSPQRHNLSQHRPQITQLGSERDALAAQISQALFDLEFDHQAISTDLTRA